jgi:HPt (histidine-containing phosphotransfer) domain-containing protein
MELLCEQGGPIVTNEPLLSMEETLERMAGDRGLLVSLFQLFVSDAPRKLEKIEACADQKDLYGVERTAHSLKGASATVGATRLCLLAAETERAAKAGSWDEVQRLSRNLARVCDQTLAAIRDFCANP